MLGPARANLARFLVALAVLALFAFIFGGGLSGPGLWLFLIGGFIGFGMGDTALFEAYSRIGARRTLLLTHTLAPPIAAITELLWMGVGLNLHQVVCIALILAGLLFALRPGNEPALAPKILLIGILFGVFSAIGQAWGAVISRQAFAVTFEAGLTIDALTATFQRLIGGIWFPLLVVYLQFRRSGAMVPKSAPPRAAGWVVINGLSGPVLGVACFQWALSTTPSAIVLAIIATTPLVVMPMTWLLEGDKPPAASLAGGALAVAGVAGLLLLG